MFCTKIVEKIKRYILSSITLFRKSCCLWGNKCIIVVFFLRSYDGAS